MNRKDTIIFIVCFAISAISGILSQDFFIGGIALFTALMSSYYASVGKRITYVMGFINVILIGLISFKNNLYGLFFFNLFVFAPLQIQGYMAWNRHIGKDDVVKVREFTLKNSIIITASCVLGSLLVGYILTLVPNQRLAFMDSASNCINLCAVILMILRYKECWWIWIFNNTIDLGIWFLTLLNGGEGALMMFLVAIGYFVLNIYGIIKWNREAKKGRRRRKIRRKAECIKTEVT